MLPRHHLPELQVLRGIAALAVVLFHIEWIGVGSFGVDIFFVLSGFIIAHVTASDARHFALKRIIRIVPLYWLATCAVFVAASAMPGLFAVTQPTLANLVRSLFFIPYIRADGVAQPLLFLGWTLNYEILFYGVFAGALAVARGRARPVAMGLLAALVAAGIFVPETWVALHFWTRPVLLEFIFGLAIWTVWRRDGFAGIPSFAAIALIAAAAVLLVVNPVKLLAIPVFGFPFAGVWATMAMIGVLALGPLLAWPRVLILLGDISFSLYLLHPYTLRAVGLLHPLSAQGTGLVFTALGLAVAIGGAWASYRLVELPSLAYLRRYLIGSEPRGN